MALIRFSDFSKRFTVVYNTLSQVVGRVVTSGVAFLVSLLIARTYGASTYGEFIKITTYVAFFYLLSDFGLNAIYLQRATFNKIQEEERQDWNLLLSLRVVLSLVLIFFCLALLVFLPYEGTRGYPPLVRFGIILFAPSILFQSVITSANALFQKHLRYDLATVATGVGSLTSLTLVYSLVAVIVVSPLSSLFGPAGILAGSIFHAFTSLYISKRYVSSIHFNFEWQKAKQLFLSSLPLGLTLLFNQIYFRVDSFILALTRGSTEVGYYGFAYKVFELLLVIPTFFMNATYPLFLEKQNKDKSEMLKLVKRSVYILFIISLILGMISWLAAPLFQYVRPDFLESLVPFRILLVSLPLFYLTSATMWTLIAFGKQTNLMVLYFVSMFVTVLADIIFIPQYGYLAASWITVLSEALVLGLSSLVLRDFLRSPEEKKIISS